MPITVISPYQDLVSTKLNVGIKQSGADQGYPEQKYHDAEFLIGTGGEQESSYGFYIGKKAKDGLSLPLRVPFTARMVNYNCWELLGVQPNPSQAPEPVSWEVLEWSSDTQGSATEATQGYSVSGTLSAEVFGCGASVTVEQSVQFTKTLEQSSEEGRSIAREFSVKPGQRGQLWQNQTFIRLTANATNVLNEAAASQHGANDFFDTVLAPGYEAGGHDPDKRVHQMGLNRIFAERSSVDDVKMDLAKFAKAYLPHALSTDLVLDVKMIYATYSGFDTE